MGLQGSGFHLSQTHFLASPGQLLLVDFSVANPHASQVLELWKEEDQIVPSSVRLTFPQAGPLIYLSHANGSELLIRFCDADFQVDRPVKVDGTPPLVQSKHSLLILFATPINRLIYLYDDNLIADTAEIENQDPYLPEQMALAMSNALFKVTQPNGCLLFGQLNEAFSKVIQGNLFLSFGLLAYIPTLPDPYAANLGLIKTQFRGNAAGVPFGAGATLQGWLVSRTAWSGQESGDQVSVTFHFSPLDQLFGGISLDAPEETPEPNPNFGGPGNFTAISGRGPIKPSALSDLDNPGNRLSAIRFSNTLDRSEGIKSNDFSGTLTHKNKSATKYGTTIWTNTKVRQLLLLYGLPTDSSLSVVVVEVLPQIRDIFDHVSGLQDTLVAQSASNFMSANQRESFNQSYQRRFSANSTHTTPTINLNSPVSDELGHHRIKRTTRLTKVPDVCCTDCE